jgi:hypothetical protein
MATTVEELEASIVPLAFGVAYWIAVKHVR